MSLKTIIQRFGSISSGKKATNQALGYFEGISGVLQKRSNLRKCLSDAGLELVQGGGIEPSTHGFSDL